VADRHERDAAAIEDLLSLPKIISEGSRYTNSTKSMVWRGPSDADRGHFSISIHKTRVIWRGWDNQLAPLLACEQPANIRFVLIHTRVVQNRTLCEHRAVTEPPRAQMTSPATINAHGWGCAYGRSRWAFLDSVCGLRLRLVSGIVIDAHRKGWWHLCQIIPT
jgi:hypothetical protein